MRIGLDLREAAPASSPGIDLDERLLGRHSSRAQDLDGQEGFLLHADRVQISFLGGRQGRIRQLAAHHTVGGYEGSVRTWRKSQRSAPIVLGVAAFEGEHA